jgi:hypothetical protein
MTGFIDTLYTQILQAIAGLHNLQFTVAHVLVSISLVLVSDLNTQTIT